MKGLILVVLIAITIIVLIQSGVFSNKGSSPTDQLNRARIDTDASSLETKIRNISHALDNYFSDHGEFPEILDLLVPTYLRTEEELLDPWRSKFRLERDFEMNLILKSAGRDLIWGNEDDITRRI